MVWEPYALALVFGLIVSAAIYFVVMWPQVEPPDEEAEAEVTAAPATDEVAASPLDRADAGPGGEAVDEAADGPILPE